MLYAPAINPPTLRLQNELYRLFEGTLGQTSTSRSEWTPAVDIRETDQELSFSVEIAGSDASDVDVTTENGVLTIRGERGDEWKDEGAYHLVERGHGSYLRRFQLPEGVDLDKIQADIQNGLLQVRIPKSAMPQPKTIPVKAISSGKKSGRLNGRTGSRQDEPLMVGAASAAK